MSFYRQSLGRVSFMCLWPDWSAVGFWRPSTYIFTQPLARSPARFTINERLLVDIFHGAARYLMRDRAEEGGVAKP